MSSDRLSSRADDAALEREAIAWLLRVTDEGATSADRTAMERWQAASPAHARAFAKASRVWQAVPSAIETGVKSGQVSLVDAGDRSLVSSGRRGLLIGLGASAAAAAMAYAVIDPPFGLWPSLSEFGADYRTATGQQRRITLSSTVSVEMNTQTSIALRPATDAFHRFELIAGEAIVGTAANRDGPVQVMAANGLIMAEAADFDIRCDRTTTSVTCLSGTVRVAYRDHVVELAEKQQVSYGGGEMGATTPVDPAFVTAWRDGYLMFRKEPLAHVISEVNRYRPGRIVLLDRRLEQELVTARFKLDRLDDVIAQVREVFGARIRNLPGGVVLVG